MEKHITDYSGIKVGPWITVEQELPAFGERVEVKGRNTIEWDGDNFPGYPISWRREIYGTMKIPTKTPGVFESGAWTWESTSWRGLMGITHWRTIGKKESLKIFTLQRRDGAPQ